MKISFACPSCGARGSVDGSLVGQGARCKQCRHRFVIRSPDDDAPDVYSLDDPAPAPTAFTPADAGAGGSVFVSARGDEPANAPPKRAAQGSGTRPVRERNSAPASGSAAPRTWLAGAGVAGAVALAGVALFAPGGVVIAGNSLMAVGSLMVLIGYAAGAYGAFSEDFLYGCLYLVIPLYAAYYLITRWDDLWAWAVCSTAGVALVALGTRLVVWAGAAV